MLSATFVFVEAFVGFIKHKLFKRVIIDCICKFVVVL